MLEARRVTHPAREQRRGGAPPKGFVAFWEQYPKKKAKGTAEKAWRTLQPDGELQQKILVALDEQRQSPDWLKDGARYVPYPATWLRARRWEDEAVTTAESVPELPPAIGSFLQRYIEIYAECRSGAEYTPDARACQVVEELLQRYSPERLEAMVKVFLLRRDIKDKNTPGTIGQFRHMAPDCDRLLREAGR